MSKIIAVIAAHPDDEILGCGATISKHIEQGDKVHVLIVSEGLTSRVYKREVNQSLKELSDLKRIAIEANKCVGTTTVDFLGMPDNRLDSVDLLDIIKKIENFKQKYLPDIVYTHHASDVNIDHQRVHEAVITATRPVPGEVVKTILCFETVSSTEWQPSTSKISFMPNWFNVITISQMEKKIKALEIYSCEMRAFPHARSIKAIEALATWRGASIGNNYSEAFVVARNII